MQYRAYVHDNTMSTKKHDSMESMTCKDFRKMIDAFDKKQLDIDTMSRFVEHVSGCLDCQEEYEIYYIMKYALSDDEIMDIELASQPIPVQRLVNSYDFKALVTYRLREAASKLDKIKRNDYYNRCLFAIAQFCVVLMAVFYIFSNVFM